MSNMMINQMGLPQSMANVFSARNILTAKDALSLTEYELMELLDVDLAEVKSAISHISQIVCPPYQTALSLMEQRVQNENLSGHLPTRLKGLDRALSGGIPFGVLTELVGPAGIGKTQFCLKLALLASLPASFGGLDGHVIYIDVESKFNSRRMIEIGADSFPEVFHTEGMAQKMAGRILVLQPSSLAEFSKSLQQIKILLLENQVKLLIIDSMAALVTREYEQRVSKHQTLAWHISFIKSLAEFSRIPIIVTNQVRSRSCDEVCQFPFQALSKDNYGQAMQFDSHLVAALGIHWAHAVTIRLILEAKSGQRIVKVAKSPFSPPLAFPFIINASGISLLNDDGWELAGPQINAIHAQGHNDVIHFNKDMLDH